MNRFTRPLARGATLGLCLAITAIAVLLVVRFGPVNTDILSPKEKRWLEENHRSIEVLFGSEAPPNAFHNEDGVYTGLLIDFLHEIESVLNVRFTVRNLSNWSELLSYARTHRNVLIVGIAETADRSRYLSFTDPFTKIPYVLVTPEQRPVPSLSEIRDQTIVCTVADYAVNDFIREHYPGITPSQTRDNLTGLRAVATGQCDVMVVNQAYATFMIQDQGLANLTIAGESGYLNRLCAAVSKKDPVLYGILEKAVDSISSDRRSELSRKWILFSGKKQLLNPEVINTLLVSAGILLTIIVALWFWTLSLRATVRRQTRRITADLNRIKTARAELKKSENMYRGVIEHSQDGIFLATRTNLEIVNRKFLELFEVDREEAMSRDFDLFAQVDKKDRKQLAHEMHRIRIQEQQDLTMQFEAVSRSGNRILLEGSFSPLLLDDTLAIQGILRDITAKRRLEEQLRQSQKMEALGRLAGGVAHDFNNMLTVINGYSELLLSSLPETDSLHSHARQIHYAGEKAAALTGQLLAFSRKQVLSPEPLSLNESITNMQPMLTRIIGEDITLTVLPGKHDDKITADAGQVEQILLNLAVNAREAMPEGGTLLLETSLVELDESYGTEHTEIVPGRYVQLSVSDTGVGMDKETASRIFEPFFTTKAGPDSTGLGLATVYGIVKQSRGHIRVYSEPGRGTTFKVYLPVTEKREQENGQPDSARPSRGKETILVVEDEPHVLDLTGQILEEFGYTPILTGSPAEALEVAAQTSTPVHLVLTDVIMPKLNGRQLVDRLKPLLPEAKVLYMSGYTGNALSDTNVLPKETCFIQKPFTPKQLALKVRSALDQKPDREEN